MPLLAAGDDRSRVERRSRNLKAKACRPDWPPHPTETELFPGRHKDHWGIQRNYDIVWSDSNGVPHNGGLYETLLRRGRDNHRMRCAQGSPGVHIFSAKLLLCVPDARCLSRHQNRLGNLNKSLHIRTSCWFLACRGKMPLNVPANAADNQHSKNCTFLNV